MSEEQQEPPTVEVTGPMGTSMRARGYDAITLLLVVAVVINGVISYVSTTEIKSIGTSLSEANRQTGVYLQEAAKAQRFMSCIIATNESRRLEEYMDPTSLCHTVTR